jgi:hypothetical protein
MAKTRTEREEASKTFKCMARRLAVRLYWMWRNG